MITLDDSVESAAMVSAGRLRIMVRMPNWVGDCIMALPALRYVHDALPGAELTVACRRPLADFMQAQNGVASVVVAPESGWGRLATTIVRGVPEISKVCSGGDIDLGVLFTNSLSTALWLWRAGVRNRLGYDLDHRRGFLTHPILCDKRINALHFIDYYIELAKRAVSAVKSWQNHHIVVENVFVDEDFLTPQISLAPEGKSKVDAILTSYKIENGYAVISPASAFGPVKDWPVEYYRELAGILASRYEIAVFVCGSPSQHNVCEKIAAEFDNVHNLAGQTELADFLALVAGASLYVGGDSGGAHAAAAFGVPTLVIFGITNPARTFPSGPNVSMLGKGARKPIDLSTAQARAQAEEALRSISVEEAADAVELMLED